MTDPFIVTVIYSKIKGNFICWTDESEFNVE